MEFNPIHLASHCFILHPEHEDIVLQSGDEDIEKLREEWDMFNKYRSSLSITDTIGVPNNREIPVSFAAFLMWKRIQLLRTFGTDYIPSIWSYKTNERIISESFKAGGKRELQYGFITDRNRRIISEEDEYTLYDISIDEAILVQEDLLYELIDLDVYDSDSIEDLFYHNPKVLYTPLGNGEYLLHKYSICAIYNESENTIILSHDMKAALMKEGWTDKDFRIKYPGYIPLYIEDIDNEFYLSVGDFPHEGMLHTFLSLLERRPHILTTIYPGVTVSKKPIYDVNEVMLNKQPTMFDETILDKVGDRYEYAPRLMHMIDERKLPYCWRQDKEVTHITHEDSPLFGDGIYRISSYYGSEYKLSLSKHGISIPIPFWTKPETVFTIGRRIKEAYIDLCIITHG